MDAEATYQAVMIGWMTASIVMLPFSIIAYMRNRRPIIQSIGLGLGVLSAGLGTLMLLMVGNVLPPN